MPVPFDLRTIDTGNTAWLLASSALVLLMTPGLALFYGGMVRAKNVLGMLMQNFVIMAVVSIVWVLVGYSIAFGGANAYLGGLHFTGLAHMDQQVPGFSGPVAQSVPPLVFVAFQMMFAIITPALLTGATADRWNFGPFVIFMTLWAVVVYSPIAHWVFSPTGWLYKRGLEDFAGGTVVECNAGIAAIVAAAVLGRRRGWPGSAFRPHNVPYILLGAGLLWFGWFGFNAGSALGATTRAAYAFLDTNTAAAAGLLAWIGVERLRDRKATTFGAASGAIAGLVAITPACGFVTPMGSIAIGLVAGAACGLATAIKGRVGIDDSLDVGAVHLVGGVLGTLLIGVFGDSHIGGANGVFRGGGFSLLGRQALGVGATVAYSAAATTVLAVGINLVWRMRMDADAELEGMDSVLHGESAYEMGAGSQGAFAEALARPGQPR